jgi:hypothetical protein
MPFLGSARRAAGYEAFVFRRVQDALNQLRSISLKDNLLDVLAHHPASPWHHAFGTFAPHTATAPQGGLSLGLLPCQRQGRPMSRPAYLWLASHAPLWPMQCAHWGSLQAAPKPAMTAGRSWLSLPATHQLDLETGLSTRPNHAVKRAIF